MHPPAPETENVLGLSGPKQHTHKLNSLLLSSFWADHNLEDDLINKEIVFFWDATQLMNHSLSHHMNWTHSSGSGWGRLATSQPVRLWCLISCCSRTSPCQMYLLYLEIERKRKLLEYVLFSFSEGRMGGETVIHSIMLSLFWTRQVRQQNDSRVMNW